MAPSVVVLASDYGPSSGHLEATIAGVGVGIAVVCLVLTIALAVVRRGRPMRFLAGTVVALLGTLVVLSFV